MASIFSFWLLSQETALFAKVVFHYVLSIVRAYQFIIFLPVHSI